MELAQNAADAAVRGGVPGRLRLALRDGVLTAQNNGAPLDAAGVEALSTLRASSKRAGDGPAGGTAAPSAPSAGSASGSRRSSRSATPRASGRRPGPSRWSRARTRELAGAIPALAGEIAARSGHVPVLRLPFADPDPRPATALPDGFATAVELPLRDDAAVRARQPAAHRDRAGAAAGAPGPRAGGDHRRGRDLAAHRGPRRGPVHRHRQRRSQRLAGRRRRRRPRPGAARRPARRGAGPDMVVGPLGGAGHRRHPGRTAAIGGSRRWCTRRRRPTSRSALPALLLASFPLEPGPAARRARAADRLPGRAGGGRLRRPAARPGAGARAARPGARTGRPGRT